MYLILYFMLIEGRAKERTLYRILPMSDMNLNRVASEVKNMVLSNSIGIPMIALFPGFIGLIGYLVLGVGEPLFWFVVPRVFPREIIVKLRYSKKTLMFSCSNHVILKTKYICGAITKRFSVIHLQF